MKRAEAKALGLTRYDDGKPCKYGHGPVRFVSTGGCVECVQLAKIARRADPIKRAEELARQREHRASDPEPWRERERTWRAQPESKAIKARIQRDRRARKREAGGDHSLEDIAIIAKQQKYRCAYCRCKLGKKFECDHIVPLALSGTNDRTNIQLLCPSCNRRKRSIHPIEFARRLGKLL